ncbi:hypothetical protein F5887DRAFT_889803 [Amanita rubescens]|nr:hypothetical protein F5887DRAFT_889803 [Amanita rubescens]
MLEKVEDVVDAIAVELAGSVRTCETASFLKTFLHVPDATLESIFASVKTAGHYSATGQRWSNFPTEKGAKFYKPFVMAAEAIHSAVPGEKNDLQGQWHDRHDKSPASSEESAKARPDCLFVSRPDAVIKLEAEEGQQSVWWRQIHIPVEIKPTNTNQMFDIGMRQACSYLRLVLREQLDRRFGIALLLCKDELTVLFNDRSGLFYTKDSINIHADPRKFVQVIAAFSILRPCQIGWDPRMKVYDPESGDTRVSYHVGDETRFFKPNLAKTHWEIDIPSDVKGKREKVITLAALSISRSEVMCGRATLVWEVIRKATPFNTNEVRQLQAIFVLKRYWRPYQQAKNGEDVLPSFMPEGERYRQVPLWGDRIYSDEDIPAADGKDDSTLEHIRCGVELGSSTPEMRSRKRARSDGELVEYMPVTVDPCAKPFLYVKEKHLVSRVHTQIIHTYTGWPLRHFKDLNELLRVIRDIVSEHKHLYYEGLVLHRDISIENIIITSRNDETVGRLIDLDHAKVVDSSTRRMTSNANPQTIRHWKSTLSGDHYFIDYEVIEKLLTYFPEMKRTEAEPYIMAVVGFWTEHFGLKMDHEIKLSEMGWHHQVKDSPAFSTHEPREGHQTGTLPFISVETLNGRPIYELPNDQHEELWCHDAVHDIESLFWVLAYICLVREGPGINMLRRDLLKNNAEGDRLEGLLHSYFDSPDRRDIRDCKRGFFDDRTLMGTDILANFDDYFEPLKNMMDKWWRILVLAYKYRKFEYYTIHDQVIHILNEAIENLSNYRPTHVLKTEDEIKRRQDLRKERVKWFEAKNNETITETSGDRETTLPLEFSPQRPIRVSVVDRTQPHTDPGSPSPNPKKQKLEDIPSLGNMVR